MGRGRCASAGALVLVMALVAACQPGDPDEDFGDGGEVVLGAGVPSPGPVSLVAMEDGGVVVARRDGTLDRLDAAGEPVPGWEQVAPPVPCPTSDAADPFAGGVLLACTRVEAGATVHDLVAVGPDGAPAAGFGTGGVVRLTEPLVAARAVPLPGGRVLALGARPQSAGSTPTLVTIVVGAGGAVEAVDEVALDAPRPDLNGYPLASWSVDVVARATRAGAVAVVRVDGAYPANGFTVVDGDPYVLHLDASGRVARRSEGPDMTDVIGRALVHDVAEAPDGGLAFALERHTLSSFQGRPIIQVSRRVEAFAPDGRRTLDALPTAVSDGGAQWPVDVRAVLVTPRGGRVLAAGTTWTGSADTAVVLAYDTATGELDPDFGDGGVARHGGSRGHDLVAQAGVEDRAYLAADDGTAPVVTRLWA